MDYEKKYKKALERAKSLIGDTIIEESGQHIAEVIFPELAESEDERIRKAIHIYLDWLDGRKDCQPKGDYTIKDMIAWLEKQGENEANKMPIWKHWKDGICGNGEGKPIYLIKDGDAYSISSVLGYECDYIELSELDKSISVKDIEKPVGKVEPKFQNGQWIVWQNKCYKVNYNGCGYELIDQNGLSTSLEYETIDGNARLWDITKDAKSGDLIYVSTEEKGIQAIFDKFDDGIIYFHCSLCGDFTQGGYMPMGDVEFVCPLQKTHYQRFFQKMKEAGYEWSDKNRKLSHSKVTKISDQVQKPAWSEEDEVKINRIVACLENLNVADNDILLKDVDWLKSLKDRVQPQPNQEWSEEDEKIAKTIINEFEQSSEWYCANGLTKEDCIAWVNKQMHTKWSEEDKKKVNNLYVLLDQMVSFNMLSNKDATEFKDWLKSLRPQLQWKPSDEQMEALKHYVDTTMDGDIDLLYQDLKELKGE